MTFSISFFALILALLIGAIGALALEGHVLFFRYLARAYVEGIRGTPFLVQINFFYFIIATALGMNSKYLLGIAIQSIFTGAYVTEIIRGGIQSIPQSQWVTARALSFSRWQTYRFIVAPQVLRRILPSLAGQLSSLVKDSSLLSVIAVSEFTMNVMEVDSLTFRTFENLTFLALGYLAITVPISLLSKQLEKRFFYAS
jgi:polar amino acid transport system permease protein